MVDPPVDTLSRSTSDLSAHHGLKSSPALYGAASLADANVRRPNSASVKSTACRRTTEPVDQKRK